MTEILRPPFFEWPLVKFCKAQLKDINPDDIVDYAGCNLFRKCNVLISGGGYDKSPIIMQRRYNFHHSRGCNHFVVQLHDCPLRCWYCYVTQDGVHGKPTYYPTRTLVAAFGYSGASVFHLMGGAPALYIEHWNEIARSIPQNTMFHSDFILVEKDYDIGTLQNLASIKNSIYAIGIKGTTSLEFMCNTGMRWQPLESLFWRNLDRMVTSGLIQKCYFTFTHCDEANITYFKEAILDRYPECALAIEESFNIEIHDYNAIRGNPKCGVSTGCVE